MHRLAHILHGGVAGDGGLAGFGVDFHIGQMHGVGIALAGRVDIGLAGNGAAGGRQLAGQFLEAQAQLRVGLVADFPVRILHIVLSGVPNLGGAGHHLRLDILRRFDGRQAGGEGGAAAAGDESEADGVGVHHRRFHIFVGQAQGFGGLLGDGGAGAADVHRPHNQADGAVEVDGDDATGLKTAVHPVAGGHAPAPVFAGDGGLIVVVAAGGLQALHEPDAAGHRPLDAPGAFLGGVAEAEFDGVEAQFAGHFVHHRLHAKGGLGRAGGAVGGGLGLVHHHIVAVNLAVFHIVAGKRAGHRLHHRRAGVGAGIHRHFRLHGGDAPVVPGPHLDFHPGTGGRAGGFEHLGAGHQLLHRGGGLAGKQRGDAVEVGGDFAAESAADFHRRNLDFRHRQPQHIGHRAAHGESALRAGPEVELAVAVPESGGVVRLDVALMHRGGGEFALDDHIGLSKPLGRIALFIGKMGGDVAGRGADFAHGVGAHFFVQQRGVALHRRADIHHRRQRFVVNLDEGQGFFGGVGVDGGHCCHRVALEQRLVAGQHMVGGVLQPGVVAAQFLFGEGGERQIFGGDHRLHAGMGGGFGGVDGLDAGVGIRAAENFGVEQSVQLHIRAVLRPPGHLVHAVGTHRALPDDIVFDFRKHDVGGRHWRLTSLHLGKDDVGGKAIWERRPGRGAALNWPWLGPGTSWRTGRPGPGCG